MKQTKTLTVGLALLLSLCLAACSAPAAATEPAKTTAAADTQASGETPAPAETPAGTEVPAGTEAPAPAEPAAPASELSGMKDGQYTVTSAVGYGGNMTITTTIENGQLASVEIGANSERPFYLEQVQSTLIPAVLEGQTTSVDIVSGASLTSYAVLEGINAAIGMSGGTLTVGDGNPLNGLPQSPSYYSLQGLTGEERNEALLSKNQQAAIEYTPERQTLESGVVVQTIPYDRFAYNTTMLHADERGCTACHALEDAVQSMAVSHPELMMTYNVEMTYWNCLMCHTSRNPLRESIHSVHYFSDTFNNMNGNCLSCHQINGTTGEYTLWDDVKYEVMTGFTTPAVVEGDFKYEQDRLSDINETFWYWGNGNNRGLQPNYSTSQEIFDQWTITITGAVEEEITLSLPELAAENSVTQIMKLSCNVNQPGGSLIGNWEVTGIPISYILEKAQLKEGADGVQFVSDDRWNAGSVPLDFLTEYPTDSLLVYKVNGDYLTPEHGYPVQVMLPSSSAASFTKRVNEFRVTAGADLRGRMTGNRNAAEGGWYNKPNAAIFYYDNGRFFDLGQPITFEGYADAFDEEIVAVEFSLDMGKNWTRYEVTDTTTEKWVYWTFEYTPQTAGSYVLYVQAITETGLVSPQPGRLMFNVE